MKRILVIEKEPNITSKIKSLVGESDRVYWSKDFVQARLNQNNDVVIIDIAISNYNIATIEEFFKNSEMVVINPKRFSEWIFHEKIGHVIKMKSNVFFRRRESIVNLILDRL